jgi:hypothetical protein
MGFVLIMAIGEPVSIRRNQVAAPMGVDAYLKYLNGRFGPMPLLKIKWRKRNIHELYQSLSGKIAAISQKNRRFIARYELSCQQNGKSFRPAEAELHDR